MLDSTAADLDVALLENDGGCATDHCLQIASGGAAPETLTFTASAPGEVFFFAVDAESGIADDFTIEVQCGANFNAEVCTNGVDDDGDSIVDCADPNCASYHSCATPSHVCDGLINNGLVGEDVKIDSRIGASVVGVPDMNGDDFAELMVGMPAANVPQCESGAALIIDLSE